MIKLNSRYLALIIVTLFILGIGGTMLFNVWQTESGKTPRVFEKGEFAGQFDPGDIRGSYSFADIEKAFSIPPADLARAFGIPNTPQTAEFLCKELEDMYGIVGDEKEIGTDSVRLFVAAYLGIPYTPESSTVLPSPAFSVLKEKANLSPDMWEALKALRVSVAPSNAGASSLPVNTEEDRTIKGKTTFADLNAWGLSAAEIEDVLGLPPGPPGITVRDYLNERNIEFSTVKETLQDLVDKHGK